MAMKFQGHVGIFAQTLENCIDTERIKISYCVCKTKTEYTCFFCFTNDFAKKVEISAAGIFTTHGDFKAMIQSIWNYIADACFNKAAVTTQFCLNHKIRNWN